MVLKAVVIIFCGILKTCRLLCTLQNSNWNCATALSILVIIVSFSVTTTCVYINSTYKWRISMDMTQI